jgi:hypothetical protein
VCQTPVVYVRGDQAKIDVTYNGGRTETVPGSSLDEATTQHILDRDGHVARLQVTVVH